MCHFHDWAQHIPYVVGLTVTYPCVASWTAVEADTFLNLVLGKFHLYQSLPDFLCVTITSYRKKKPHLTDMLKFKTECLSLQSRERDRQTYSPTVDAKTTCIIPVADAGCKNKNLID